MEDEIKDLIRIWTARRGVVLSSNMDCMTIQGQKNIARAELLWECIKDLRCLLANEERCGV